MTRAAIKARTRCTLFNTSLAQSPRKTIVTVTGEIAGCVNTMATIDTGRRQTLVNVLFTLRTSVAGQTHTYLGSNAVPTNTTIETRIWQVAIVNVCLTEGARESIHTRTAMGVRSISARATMSTRRRSTLVDI